MVGGGAYKYVEGSLEFPAHLFCLVEARGKMCACTLELDALVVSCLLGLYVCTGLTGWDIGSIEPENVGNVCGDVTTPVLYKLIFQQGETWSSVSLTYSTSRRDAWVSGTSREVAT